MKFKKCFFWIGLVFFLLFCRNLFAQELTVSDALPAGGDIFDYVQSLSGQAPRQAYVSLIEDGREKAGVIYILDFASANAGERARKMFILKDTLKGASANTLKCRGRLVTIVETPEVLSAITCKGARLIYAKAKDKDSALKGIFAVKVAGEAAKKTTALVIIILGAIIVIYRKPLAKLILPVVSQSKKHFTATALGLILLFSAYWLGNRCMQLPVPVSEEPPKSEADITQKSVEETAVEEKLAKEGIEEETPLQESATSPEKITKSSVGAIGTFAKDWGWSKERNQDGEFAETKLSIKLPASFKKATLVLQHSYSQQSGEAKADVYLSTQAQVAPEDEAHHKGNWWVGKAVKLGYPAGSFTTSYSGAVSCFEITDILRQCTDDSCYVAVQNLATEDIGVSQIYIEIQE